MIKINLASGQRPFKDGWTNIDIKEQGYKVDILADARELFMIESESVDIIVAHHLVEHIPIHDLEGYVFEWWRVLKPGGILSVFVPNLKEIDKAWLDGKITTFIHNVNTYGAYQNSIHDLHKWGYDQEELDARICSENHETKERKFNFTCQGYNPANSLYQNADIAQDWWILSREFVKP